MRLWFVLFLLVGQGCPALVQAYTAEQDGYYVNIRLWAADSIKRMEIQQPSRIRVENKTFYAPIVLISKPGNKVLLIDSIKQYVLLDEVFLESQDAEAHWHLQSKEMGDFVTRGSLHIRVIEGGELQIVNHILLEEYLVGVVGPELGSLNENPESLKAQIVASRSYVLAMKGRHEAEGYDFCDQPHCQVYGGLKGIPSAIWKMLATVRGEYVAYEGAPIPAFFHDTCGGVTADPQEVWKIDPKPYLKPHKDGSPQAHCRFSPHSRWTVTLSEEDLKDFLRKQGWLKGRDALISFKVIRSDHSGRAQQIIVQGNQQKWIPARVFVDTFNRSQKQYELRSTFFQVIRLDDDYHFIGRGWGHGVGLCQWGAMQLAKEGKSYRQILATYFPGTEVETLSQPALAQLP